MEICHIHRAEESVCGIPQSYPSLSYIQRDQVRPGTCPSSPSEKHCHSEVCCVTHRMVWHLLVISLSVSLCLCSVVCYNYSCLGVIQHKQCPCIVIPRFNKKSIGSLEFLGLKKIYIFFFNAQSLSCCACYSKAFEQTFVFVIFNQNVMICSTSETTSLLADIIKPSCFSAPPPIKSCTTFDLLMFLSEIHHITEVSWVTLTASMQSNLSPT